MDRRSVLVSGLSVLVSSAVAGCLGGDGSEPEDQGDSFDLENRDYRDIRIESEHLLRLSDSLVVEGDDAFVTLRIENTGPEPLPAEITLRMRDTEGEPIGSLYSRQTDPIRPRMSVLVRIDVDQPPDAVAGYEITVFEGPAS